MFKKLLIILAIGVAYLFNYRFLSLTGFVKTGDTFPMSEVLSISKVEYYYSPFIIDGKDSVYVFVTCRSGTYIFTTTKDSMLALDILSYNKLIPVKYATIVHWGFYIGATTLVIFFPLKKKKD